MRRRGRPPSPGPLTARELEVLWLLRQGLTNQQIADRLGISLAGAKFHVSEIISRLGVSSREEAARWAEPAHRGLRAVVGGLLAGKLGLVKAGAAMAVVAGLGGLVLLFAMALANRPADSGQLGKIAYVVDGDLWVRSLPSGRPLRLTNDHAAASPRWSPSGEWLIYQHGPLADPGEIGPRIVHVDGSRERRFAANTQLAWSPLEDMLAVSQPDGSLSVEKADGSGRRQVLPPVPGGGQLDRRTGLVWSSDGRWIVFEEDHQDHQSAQGGFAYVGIRAVRADGTGEHEIFSVPVVSSDGSQAVTELTGLWSGQGGAPAYLTLGPAVRDPAVAGGLPLNLRAALALPAGAEAIGVLAYRDFFALSPDSSSLAVVEGLALSEHAPGTPQGTGPPRLPPPRDAQTNKRIVVIDLNSGRSTALTPPDMVAVAPAWSPTGDAIAYVARPDTGPVDLAQSASAEAGRHIWTMSRSGDDQQQIRTDGADCRQERPLWSSDASTLLFACLDSEQAASLWMVPAGGGRASKVADGLSMWTSPGPGARTFFAGYQGHVDWPLVYDYWPGKP
jgi:DNA-binding CsgD family transcriptional regulator